MLMGGAAWAMVRASKKFGTHFYILYYVSIEQEKMSGKRKENEAKTKLVKKTNGAILLA